MSSIFALFGKWFSKNSPEFSKTRLAISFFKVAATGLYRRLEIPEQIGDGNADAQRGPKFFAGFSASIELDQLRVDALRSLAFHRLYDDHLWRVWRRDHTDFFGTHLKSVDEVSSSVLFEITEVACKYDPGTIRAVVLDVCGEEVMCGIDER
ncbi:hypothetical protein [Bradyrhizobium sp. th.b2]|uniref:hypothetical protein n=1 Tax=Bradyrhizobium sp. th-b2 TaxID=172088 RepID=UPI0012EBD31E|nr:hypothetical protein [Bradyrhizobium sp. th.b2]